MKHKLFPLYDEWGIAYDVHPADILAVLEPLERLHDPPPTPRERALQEELDELIRQREGSKQR